MKKPREYCCCAIPLVNAGIYATLIEQLVLGILVGTLAFATPSIVGASTFSWSKWVLCIVAYVGAGVQLLGFIGVSREKPSLFKTYITLNGIVTSLGFSVAAAWIIMSATRHSTAKAKCLLDFFTTADGATASEGDTLCTIFPWVDVGIMGGLWLILGILQIYLMFVIGSYGASQRRDHEQYDRVYDPTQPLTADNIPLEQNDPWDSRPSGEYQYTDKTDRQNNDYKHLRNQSSVSASEVFNQPYQEPKDSFSTSRYEYDPNPPYPSRAYTQEPVPTPVDNFYYSRNDSNYQAVERPSQVQSHPAEGSLGRKTPRMQY